MLRGNLPYKFSTWWNEKNETPSKNDFKADLSDFVKRDEITHLEERTAKLDGLNAKQTATANF